MDTSQIRKYSTILTIAGSDSSAGAGIQADIKTAAAFGVHASTAISSITAQNTCGIIAISDVDPYMLQKQIEAIVTDEKPLAVKTGMLPSPQAVEVVANAIRRFNLVNIVVDPVLISSSGTPMSDKMEDTIKTMKTALSPLATLVTPNIPEAITLSGLSKSDILNNPLLLPDRLNCPGILLKGGHSDTDCDDILIAEKETTTFTSKRIGSRNTHGTGCVLSSAIASCLALGLTLREAVKHAKNFVTRAIEEGKNLHFGNGHGPLFLLDKYNSMQ